MKSILVIGAGLSSSYLIKHLASFSKKENFTLTVADASIAVVEQRIKKFKNINGIALDINNKEERQKHINNATVVISLLPPALHVTVATDCIKYKKHLVTASYISEPMQQLHTQALKADVLLLNEMGLDPGIDHLSAIKLIHQIQQQGGVISSFKSYCGGLVAPEFDNNPWNYKFTWNPKNVITAGQSIATYLENGQIKYIPPNKIFNQTQDVTIKNLGKFESYANRDSLGYIKPYGIQSAKNVLRGTLRKKGYCSGWQILVTLGLTDDKLTLYNSNQLTYRKFLCAFIPGANSNNLEKQFCKYLNIGLTSKIFKKIQWLGLFEHEKIELANATPAQILLGLLEKKWKLNQHDLDMVVMKHEISYLLKGKNHKIHSSLVVTGDDNTYTAMAKTVGLPLALAARLILKNKIKLRGVQLPVYKEIYIPVLAELSRYNIKFNEHTL